MKIRILSDLFISVLLIFALSFLSISGSFWKVKPAGADSSSSGYGSEEQAYPYTKTFTITAYYSPLPCQNRYATGSYAGDIRLNGSGIRSADGTPVYPGMIAAPRSYPFGTKMEIPGVGTVSVHDRGGAIVQGDGENTFDRLDIWMGYGDKGLTRALNWGKRTLNVVVYGKDDSVKEQIYLTGYSPDEAIPNQCEVDTGTGGEPAPQPPKDDVASSPPPSEPAAGGQLTVDLKRGDKGDQVRALQRELTNLNYFGASVTGYYGEITEHAVFKFQQANGLVGYKNSLVAGVFGPKTRDAMNRVLIARDYNNRLIADATEAHGENLIASGDSTTGTKVSSEGSSSSSYDSSSGSSSDSSSDILSDTPHFSSALKISREMDFGLNDPEVSLLQEMLKNKGFFEGALITNYFGPVTRRAVTNFQLANGIISSEEDTGAGRVGPSTLAALNG